MKQGGGLGQVLKQATCWAVNRDEDNMYVTNRMPDTDNILNT
jgi:hypothetical protein